MHLFCAQSRSGLPVRSAWTVGVDLGNQTRAFYSFKNQDSRRTCCEDAVRMQQSDVRPWRESGSAKRVSWKREGKWLGSRFKVS